MTLQLNRVSFEPAKKLALTTDSVTRDEARKQLVEMAASLVSSGSPKSGFLRLSLQNGQTHLGHGRTGSGYTAAGHLVKDLLQKAYGPNSAVVKQFQEYHEARGKVGVKSFLQLVGHVEPELMNSAPELGRLKLSTMGGRLRLKFANDQSQRGNPLETGVWPVGGRTYQVDLASKRSGADGHVVMAHDPSQPGESVCLKIDKPNQQEPAGSVWGTAAENHVFTRLASAGAAHPNIVRSMGFDPHSRVLVLEKCKGSIKDETVDSKSKLAIGLSRENLAGRAGWFAQTRSAMEHLHQNKLVHRDLNTKNILVRDNGSAALADFGNTYDFSSRRGSPPVGLDGRPQSFQEAASSDRRDLIKLAYNLLAGGDNAPPASLKKEAAQQLLINAGLPQVQADSFATVLVDALSVFHTRPSPERTQWAVDKLGQVFAGLTKSHAASPAAKVEVAPAQEGAGLQRGVLSLKNLTPEVKASLEASQGVLTKDLMRWLISSGQLKPELDLSKDHIELTEMERTGAGTLKLMMVKVNGKNAFVIKECGNSYEEGNRIRYFNYHPSAGGEAWVNKNFEDEKLEFIHQSAIGRSPEISAPGGAKFKLASAAATFRYLPERPETVDDAGHLRNVRVMHQVNLLQVASGRGMGDVLESDDPALARQAAADMGSALAAFHQTHLQSGQELPTGGLRTLIHGDFHAGNLFYDAQSRSVTAIDLAGAASNFFDTIETQSAGPARLKDRNPPGYDMLMDVKRAIDQGNQFRMGPPELKRAFLQAYAEGFKDMLDPTGQPRYTADSLDRLIQNPDLGRAFT